MSSESEINALIQLLDDDDREVYRHVHNKLKSLGPYIIPTLEQAWGAELNPATHERIEEIIHEIQFDSLVEEWKHWRKVENPDLLRGTFLLAKYHYPEINFEEIRKKIQKLKKSIWLELNYNQTPLEQVHIFNQVFYGQHNFKGTQTSSDFQDFCINNVIESKKGSSVLIGIIYQIIANDLTLPIYGVALTGHYVLAFCKKIILDFHSTENLEREVLFYINPINKGSVFSRNEIKDYIAKLKVESVSLFFTPADNTAVIKELLNNLIELYQVQNRHKRVKNLSLLSRLNEG